MKRLRDADVCVGNLARADDDVEAMLKPWQKFVQLFDRCFVVGVDEADDVAAGLKDAVADTAPFSAAIGGANDLEAQIPCREVSGGFARAVRSVGGDDYLVLKSSQLQEFADLAQRVRNSCGLVICGNDDAEGCHKECI